MNVESFTPCPDNIVVIGGGRWARVLSEVLCGLTAPSVRITVHSLHNAASMSAWTVARGLTERIDVVSDWPLFLSTGSNAVIVVNAAQDHEKAVNWALSSGVPVLVEKPIALTAVASQRLADLARSQSARFAAAHIFLFASYLDHFSKLVSNSGNIQSLRVYWTDPSFENRYGESKHYDPSLPIFADWLPHVLSIVGTLTSNRPEKCTIKRFSRDGTYLELELMLGDILCNVRLVRNSDQRRRILEVVTGQKSLQLDFSQEPGVITDGFMTEVGDPDWEYKPHPAARMLTAFLKWASGGEFDKRLSLEVGLQACKIIDQIVGLTQKLLKC